MFRVGLDVHTEAIKIARDFRDDLDRRGEALALSPRYQPVVDRIGCFRGFKTQTATVIAHAWKRQHRLYKVFHRLAAKKPKQVAATAVAREMVGFRRTNVAAESPRRKPGTETGREPAAAVENEGANAFLASK